MTHPPVITARTFIKKFVLLICVGVASAMSQAQSPNTITVRMIDNRTGLLISTSTFLVRADRQKELHGDWITQNENGTGKLVLPPGVAVISLHGTYDTATLTYVNCDADKDRGSAEHAPSLDQWYSVEKIMTSGIVAPNNCVGKKVPEKLQVIAEPGQFVFFVRPMNAAERFRE